MGGVLTAVAGVREAAADRRAPAPSVVLSVSAGGEAFVIDAGSIREIRGWTAPTPLPGAPAYVQGICDLRGETMLLVVLAQRLGLGAAPTALPVTVVVEGREGLVGLVVDSVSDLHSIVPAQVRTVPETGLTTPTELLGGLVDIEGRLLGLVAVDRIVAAAHAPRPAPVGPPSAVAID